jgi:transcriptional regulator with XRE-family HTH domain
MKNCLGKIVVLMKKENFMSNITADPRIVLEIGDEIRQILNRMDTTQADIAKRVGISATYMNRIINNKAPRVSWRIMIKISNALGIDLNKYVYGDYTNYPQSDD